MVMCAACNDTKLNIFGKECVFCIDSAPTEEKMTAQEWHNMAAATLAEANKKLIDDMMGQMFSHARELEKQERDRHEEQLRDSFASAALNGILACNKDYDGCDTLVGRVKKAYQYADEMMLARKRMR